MFIGKPLKQWMRAVATHADDFGHGQGEVKVDFTKVLDRLVCGQLLFEIV